MGTPTQFQLVQGSILQLDYTLTNIQLHASQPYSALYLDPALRNCADVLFHCSYTFSNEC